MLQHVSVKRQMSTMGSRGHDAHIDGWFRAVKAPSRANYLYPRPHLFNPLFLNLVRILTMRRAQSVRHYTRSSVPTIGADDLGLLKEISEESTEVTLRRQLLEKEKENDKVCGPPHFSPL
jgi:hypothetical protein